MHFWSSSLNKSFSYPITVNRDCTETESNVAVCTVAIVLSILSIMIAIIAVLIYLFIQKQHYSRSPSKLSQLPQNEDEQEKWISLLCFFEDILVYRKITNGRFKLEF